MKIAIQQPYFYPYVGYFNLIKSVDVFIYLNDVQYIRRGWINRNKICKDYFLTVPVMKSHRYQTINNIRIDYSKDWHKKHCMSLEKKYGKKCLNHPMYMFYKNIKKHIYLVNLLKDTIQHTCGFLKIKTKFIDSESLSIDGFKGKDRILEICKKMKARSYHNLPGGKNLYLKKDFCDINVDLNFLEISEISNFLSIFDICIGDGLSNL